VDGITCGESGCSEPTVIIPVPDYSNILVLDGMAIAEHMVDQLGASEVQYAVVRPLLQRHVYELSHAESSPIPPAVATPSLS